MDLLDKAVETAKEGNDARVPPQFKEIDIVKLFGNIEVAPTVDVELSSIACFVLVTFSSSLASSCSI